MTTTRKNLIGTLIACAALVIAQPATANYTFYCHQNSRSVLYVTLIPDPAPRMEVKRYLNTAPESYPITQWPQTYIKAIKAQALNTVEVMYSAGDIGFGHGRGWFFAEIPNGIETNYYFMLDGYKVENPTSYRCYPVGAVGEIPGPPISHSP